MVTAIRLGRPQKDPVSPLGALVAEKMEMREIPLPELAARLRVSRATLWRFLHGKTEFSRRITIETLSFALGLEAEERVAFICACAKYLKYSEMIPTEASDSPGASGSKLGDGDAKYEQYLQTGEEASPAERFGSFIKQHMRGKGMSQSRLAGILSVAPSTISRLTRGRLGTTHAVDAQLICNVLDLTEMDRRTFFMLAAQACLLPIVHRACPEYLRFHPFERSIGWSLEEIEAEIVRLRERRNHGEVAVVYQLAGELFDKLFNSSVPVTRVARSPELAHIKLLVGFEFCEAQAVHLGWYARTGTMIQTLNRMENEVLLQFPPKVFASEHNHLLNLRGPLYYKIPHQTHVADTYLESIGELTRALDSLMSLHYEPTLRVELLRNRAHAYLLHGHENERKWRADLEVARNVAAAISTDERETFQALVEYSWGEGFRQLEYQSNIAPYARTLYMNEATRLLSQSGAIFHQHHRWEGYALLADIAEAHCVSWQDADEGLRRLDRLRSAAQQFYPSLLAKIERIATVAVRQKQISARTS